MNRGTLARKDVAWSALLFLLTAALFWQAVSFGFVNFDDDQYVFENPHLANGLTVSALVACFTEVISGNWHPVTMLSHTLDVEMFGVTPNGPHAVNVLLHALNVVLAYIFVVMATGKRWPAVVCAGLFAVHPLRVESVVWISERKDVLSGLFFLLTLVAYLRHAAKPSLGRYFVMAVLFVLGLMSKPMLVTLPFLLLLLDIWPIGRVRAWRRKELARPVLERLPLLVIVAAFCVVTLLAQRSSRSVASASVLALDDRLANAVSSIAIYLQQFAFPTKLSPLYWHPYLVPADGLSTTWIALSGAIVLLLTGLALLLRTRLPWLFVGWFWFVGMLLPVIGIVQVGWQAHADRYTYLPLLGIGLIVSLAMDSLRRRSRGGSIVINSLVVGVLLMFSIATFRQTLVWRNSLSLWQHALDVQPPNPVVLNNYGSALAGVGRNDEAMAAFRTAIAMNPRSPNAMANLARQLIARGDDSAAKPLLQGALRMDARQLGCYSALAGIYLREGRPDAALSLYRQAIERSPDYADGHYNIAVTLAQQGKFTESMPHFRRVLELRPDDAEALQAMNLAQSLAQRAVSPGNTASTHPSE